MDRSTQPCLSIVTETFAPEVNGVANTLNYLSRGLQARGYRVEVVRPRQSGESRPGWRSHCDTETVTWGLPLPGYPDLRFGLACGARLRRQWRKQPPDAVYIATQGPLGWSALSVARQLGIPVATGFHTNFHQYCRFYKAGFIEPLIRRYLTLFHNRSGLTLAPTRLIQQTLSEWGIRRVACWSRGVDCQRFSPEHRSQSLREQWGLKDGAVAVLYVGRLAAEKNLVQAVASFQRLHAIHPNARFVLVGDGPLRESLQSRYPDYIFCGTQTGEALATHYASADLFLFPSRSDTFGNVVTEAMASGLAVVAFDDAAPRDLITHGVNGMKIPLENDEGFIRAAMRLADQPSLRQDICREARRKALTLDWQALVEAFEKHLMSLQTQRGQHDKKQRVHSV
ncbi:MAG: glycosyltransferase family 1 protein [Oleiphilaceae bacterium]|nr:glycosyltransferase family 1 protein [Oleiphilaceae bacterium]